MKKISKIVLATLPILILFSCTKESKTTTKTTTTTISSDAGKSFTLAYDGKTYTGSSVTFALNPEPGNPNYKNILSASTNNFSVGVFNIPESGSAALRGLLYNAKEGHCALTVNLNGSAISGVFSGTITRVSENTLQVAANHTELGKTLTGTIVW